MATVIKSEVRNLSSAELLNKWREASQNRLGSRQATYNPVTKTYTRADVRGATSYVSKEDYERDRRNYQTYQNLVSQGYIVLSDGTATDPYSAAMSKRQFTDSTQVLYVPTLSSPAQARAAEAAVLDWQRADAQTTKENIERDTVAKGFVADLNASAARVAEKQPPTPTLSTSVKQRLGTDVTTRAVLKNNELYEQQQKNSAAARDAARAGGWSYFSPKKVDETGRIRLDPLQTVFRGVSYVGVRVEDVGERIKTNVDQPYNKSNFLSKGVGAVAKYEGRALSGLGGYMVDKPSSVVGDVALGFGGGALVGRGAAKIVNVAGAMKGAKVASKVNKGLQTTILVVGGTMLAVAPPEAVGRGVPGGIGFGAGYGAGFKAGRPGIVELSVTEPVTTGRLNVVGDRVVQSTVSRQKVDLSYWGERVTANKYTESMFKGSKGEGSVLVSSQVSGITPKGRPFGLRTSRSFTGKYGDDFSTFVSGQGERISAYKVASTRTDFSDASGLSYSADRQVFASRFQGTKGKPQYAVGETFAVGEVGAAPRIAYAQRGSRVLGFKELTAYGGDVTLRSKPSTKNVYESMLIGDANYVKPRTLFGSRKATLQPAQGLKGQRVIQRPSLDNRFGGALPDFVSATKPYALSVKPRVLPVALAGSAVGISRNLGSNLGSISTTRSETLLGFKPATTSARASTPLLFPSSFLSSTNFGEDTRRKTIAPLSSKTSTLYELDFKPATKTKQGSTPLQRVDLRSGQSFIQEPKRITTPKTTRKSSSITPPGIIPVTPPITPSKFPPPPIDVLPVFKGGGRGRKGTKTKDKKNYLPSIAGIALKIKQKNKKSEGYSGLEVRGI